MITYRTTSNVSYRGFTFPGNSLFAQQMTNANAEIEAYQAQYAFDPGGMPPSIVGGVPGSMSGITSIYVGGINNPSDQNGNTSPAYPNVRNLVNGILSLIGEY